MTKNCTWLEAECSAVPSLSGCVPEQSCKMPEASSCMYDVSDCRNVAPGKLCSISCRRPYTGFNETFTCPFKNTNASTPLLGTLPDCDCGEPDPLPRGYNMTINPDNDQRSYNCDIGYAGKAVKTCAPGKGATCTVDPVLIGCSIPVPCEASFVDTEKRSSSGNVLGRVDFGPASMEGAVHEKHVLEYRIYWADKCENKLAVNAAPIGVVPVRAEGETCCRGDAYSMEIDLKLPKGAEGLLVLTSLRSGEAPIGVFVDLNLEAINRVIPMAMAHPAMRPTFVCLVAVLACLLLGLEQQTIGR